MRTTLFLLLAALCFGQEKTEYEGFPAIELANDRISLTVTTTGGAMNRILLADDPERNNPIWEPIRMARELGRQSRSAGGHFVCLDGFGNTSDEERQAGLPGHGEANRQQMEIVTSGKLGSTMAVKLRATLPIVQEVFTRQFSIVDGENVVYVDSEVESLLGFDRPVVWAEHATIGAPFLAPEVTVVDLSATRSQVRPGPKNPRVPHRLVSGADFSWPLAPAVAGGVTDVRAVPANPGSMDHTTSLTDANREHQFVTALQLEERLLFGYVFRFEEFPWLQTWDNFTADLKMARGIEFSTQPYDVPRREAISQGRMFGVPTYRWLPAKSKITARFLMFYTRVPEGFRKVDNVRLEKGQLIIEDLASGKTVTLAASQGL
jgi:hypothetical protein